MKSGEVNRVKVKIYYKVHSALSAVLSNAGAASVHEQTVVGKHLLLEGQVCHTGQSYFPGVGATLRENECERFSW